MKIEKNLSAATLTLSVIGRVDTTTAPQVETEVDAVPADVTLLVMDLARLEYISSAGLRVLLKAQKKMNKQGSLVIKNVNETVMEIFDVTGFCDILTIE